MLKNVIFVNQATTESNAGILNWAVISITDVELKEDAKIKMGWYAIEMAFLTFQPKLKWHHALDDAIANRHAFKCATTRRF